MISIFYILKSTLKEENGNNYHIYQKEKNKDKVQKLSTNFI